MVATIRNSTRNASLSVHQPLDMEIYYQVLIPISAYQELAITTYTKKRTMRLNARS